MKKKILIFCMLYAIFASTDASATVTEVYTWTNWQLSPAYRFDWVIQSPLSTPKSVNKGNFGLCLSAIPSEGDTTRLFCFGCGEVPIGSATTLGFTFSENEMLPYCGHFISWASQSEPSAMVGLSGEYDFDSAEWVVTLSNCALDAPALQVKNLTLGLTGIVYDAVTLPSAPMTAIVGWLPFSIASSESFEIRVSSLPKEFPILSANIGYSEDECTTDFKGQVVPEPASIALLGLGGLFIARRKR